jgi:hypothetical protein
MQYVEEVGRDRFPYRVWVDPPGTWAWPDFWTKEAAEEYADSLRASGYACEVF